MTVSNSTIVGNFAVAGFGAGGIDNQDTLTRDGDIVVGNTNGDLSGSSVTSRPVST